eukprot:6662806-Prymnesium_polylepis.1
MPAGGLNLRAGARATCAASEARMGKWFDSRRPHAACGGRRVSAHLKSLGARSASGTLRFFCADRSLRAASSSLRSARSRSPLPARLSRSASRSRSSSSS